MISQGINDIKDIVKEGWLTKQSKYLKEWRQRWFVLTSSAVLTFKEERKYKNPTEIISLKECTSIKSAEDETNKENSFKIEGATRTFYLIANSLQEKESWIGAVGKAMVQLNMKQNKNYDD